MEEPTIDERKNWWLLCYGVTSMEKAENTCDLLLANCEDNMHPLFQSLSVAIHAFYARPFKRSRGVGGLSADLVPKSAKGIHGWLEHFRDGVMAHTDADHCETAGRPMHDVIYMVAGDRALFSTSDPRAQVSAYADAREHCTRMREIFFDEVMRVHERFQDLLPVADGDYLLTVDASSPLFVSHAMPDSSLLRYK